MKLIISKNYKDGMSNRVAKIIITDAGMTTFKPLSMMNNSDYVILLTMEEWNKYRVRLGKDESEMFSKFRRDKKKQDDEIQKSFQNVREDSILAYTFSVYSEIDEKISRPANQLCKKGCHECCIGYFYVTDIEYYLIKCYLMANKPEAFYKAVKTAKEQMRILKELIPEEYEKLHNEDVANPMDDHSYIHSFRMCPFMDGSGCAAYQFRPLICRLYSSVVSCGVCSKICAHYSPEQITNLLSNNIVDMDDVYRNILFYPIKIGKERVMVCKKAYPLFYYLCHDAEYERHYRWATEKSMKEYMKLISNGLYVEK